MDMKRTNKISTRLKNLMKQYIGKKYDAYFYGHFFWTIEIVGLMGETGYFSTRITNNGCENPYLSNMSYGELKAEIKKGNYREI